MAWPEFWPPLLQIEGNSTKVITGTHKKYFLPFFECMIYQKDLNMQKQCWLKAEKRDMQKVKGNTGRAEKQLSEESLGEWKY